MEKNLRLEMIGPGIDQMLDALSLLNTQEGGDLTPIDGSGHAISSEMFSIEVRIPRGGPLPVASYLRRANALLRGSGCRIYAI